MIIPTNTTDDIVSRPKITNQIAVKRGYTEAMGMALETSIRWRDPKNERSPILTKILETIRMGSTSWENNIPTVANPLTKKVTTAMNGTAMDPRMAIVRKRECSVFMTIL